MIKTAIIPAAGFGTRLRPLTIAQPKEMLPLVDKPVIEWVIMEAVEVGVEEIIIIIGHHKNSIVDHFSDILDFKKRNNISSKLEIKFITQKEQKGLGHAILQTKDEVGDKPLLVLLGDTVCDTFNNPSQKLAEIFNETRKSVFALLEVPKSEVYKFGIVDVNNISLESIDFPVYSVKDLIEKPKIEDAPSQFAILGRYIFNYNIFDYIELKPGHGGELQLTDAMQKLNLLEGMDAFVYPNKRYDIGSVEDWIKANFHLTKTSKYNLE